MARNVSKIVDVGIFGLLKTPNITRLFLLYRGVLSFDLVGHM